MRSILFCLLFCVGLLACSQTRRATNGQPAIAEDAALIGKAQQVLLNDTALTGAHLGISIYDPAANRYLYNYQGDHYFVPASNTKLFTCYAAMKYLGDSLVGARYIEDTSGLTFIASGDPTFLHPDFFSQPLYELLKSTSKKLRFYNGRKILKYGPGWSWDDYEADYMPERSALPVFGNLVWFRHQAHTISDKYNVVNEELVKGKFGDSIWVEPAFFSNSFESVPMSDIFSKFSRAEKANRFERGLGIGKIVDQSIPFITASDTNYSFTAPFILHDLLKKSVPQGRFLYQPEKRSSYSVLHSQPTDSLLKPMMHRSDNFFAEQSLLMVSNERLGYMSDEAIIDTLLKTDLKDLPQKPVWVDGSGLSRYNLFTPQDVVAVLLKIKNEFGLERIRNILPKGNTGTLTNYYQQIGPAIFAKTGSLSGQVALSGFLTAKTGKLLLFSILINNYTSSGRAVRRAMEKFVLQVWQNN